MEHKWEFFDINWLGPSGSGWTEQCLVCGAKRDVSQGHLEPLKVERCDSEECSGIQVEVHSTMDHFEPLLDQAKEQGIQVILPDFVKRREEP